MKVGTFKAYVDGVQVKAVAKPTRRPRWRWLPFWARRIPGLSKPNGAIVTFASPPPAGSVSAILYEADPSGDYDFNPPVVPPPGRMSFLDEYEWD